MSRNELRVTPVKRYKTPKYPSHADPDPTCFPYPVAYPWSPKLAAAVAGLGIAASCSQRPDGSAESVPRSAAVSPAGAAGQAAQPPSNPFTLETSGLPHVSSGFGVGEPNYLEEELAREVIERVFRQAGYRFTPNYEYVKDDVACIADGYDPQRRVGYVYADYRSLDRDAEGALSMLEISTADIETVDFLLDDLASEFEYKNDRAKCERVRALQRIEDPAARRAAFLNYTKENRPDKLSLAEAQALVDSKPHDNEFIAVVSHFDERFTTDLWSDESRAALYEAEQIADPAKRLAAIKAVQERAASDTIARLEQAVREYIAWARSQGAQ